MWRYATATDDIDDCQATAPAADDDYHDDNAADAADDIDDISAAAAADSDDDVAAEGFVERKGLFPYVDFLRRFICHEHKGIQPGGYSHRHNKFLLE